MVQIKTFRDLLVWQKAHEFVLFVYQITEHFPQRETYGLSQQIRRAAVSVASNIVEGYRRSSVLQSIHFYNMAEASLDEGRYQLLLAFDLCYIDETTYNYGEALAEEVSKLLYSWKISQQRNRN